MWISKINKFLIKIIIIISKIYCEFKFKFKNE